VRESPTLLKSICNDGKKMYRSGRGSADTRRQWGVKLRIQLFNFKNPKEAFSTTKSELFQKASGQIGRAGLLLLRKGGRTPRRRSSSRIAIDGQGEKEDMQEGQESSDQDGTIYSKGLNKTKGERKRRDSKRGSLPSCGENFSILRRGLRGERREV